MIKADRIPSIAFALFTAVHSIGWADTVSPPPTDKPPDKRSSEPEDTEKPKEPSLLEKLGEQLLGGPNEETNAEDENTAKMERAVSGMRSAGSKLEDGLTTDETQRIQKQVIKDLEDIINQLENPPPNQGDSGGGGGGGGGGRGGAGASGSRGGASGRGRRGSGGSSLRVSRPQGASGRRSAGQMSNSANSEEKSGGQTNEKSADSSKKSHAQRKAEEEAERRRKLELDIWGHLPQHLKEELLNTYSERMLPKYEQMVKQFYEGLSTQGDPKKK